jgi:WXXGXW repeat (2 copies)
MREEENTSIGNKRAFILSANSQQGVELWALVLSIDTDPEQYQLFMRMTGMRRDYRQLRHEGILHPETAGENPAFPRCCAQPPDISCVITCKAVSEVIQVRKVLLALAFGFLLSLQAAVGQTVVRVAPPPPRREMVAVAPGPRYVWTGGYYRWHRGAYAWVPGRYVVPPRAHVVWVPGYWAPRRGGYVWIAGYWR